MDIRVHTISLGCPKNRVDTEWMLGGFGPGLIHAPEPEDAEVILVNTCGFIEPAVNESLQTILDAAERVASLRPRPLLVVTGCLVSRYGQELGRELPEADLFLEIARQGELGAHVRKLLGRGEDTPPSRLLTTAPGFAYLKIAEGCDNRCRFCTSF